MATAQITVSETDFRKHRANLSQLRRCHLPPPLPQVDADQEQKSELEMSFKSAFRFKCQSLADYRDPWKGIENPEGKRAPSEMDLVINQFIPPSTPKVTLPVMAAPGRTANSPGSSPRPRSRDTSYKRQSSRQRRDTSLPPSHSGCGSSTSSTASTGLAMSRNSSTSSRKTVNSRIQLCNDVEDSSNGVATTSNQTELRLPECPSNRSVAQHANTFGSDNSVAWLSVDPRSGKVDIYPREAAFRLEVGFRNKARSVNFVGLVGVLQDKMVELSGNDGRIMQVSLKGRREVRRVEIDPQAGGVSVTVTKDGTWKFSSDKSDTNSESRWVELYAHDIIGEGVIDEVPQEKRGHQFFVNVGAYGYTDK